MAGLIEKDITTPYNFTKFQNQNAETTKLQAFERANFGCFQEIKSSVRKFKQGEVRCKRELQEIQDLLSAYTAMTGSVNATFNDLAEQTSTLGTRLKSVADSKSEILQLYKDGIASLKRYELHPNLSKDPTKKSHLIDIYYAESSMNSFKTNCVSQLDKLVTKMDTLKNDFKFSYPKVVNVSTNFSSVEQHKSQLKDLWVKFENEVTGNTQQELLNLMFAIYDDLRSLHSHLDKFQITNKIDQMYLLGLMTKQGTHNRLLMESLDHVRTIELLLQEVSQLKQSISLITFKTRQQWQPTKILSKIATHKDMKTMRDNIERQHKDFCYLKKPA